MLGNWTLFGYDGLGRQVKTIRFASQPNYNLSVDPAIYRKATGLWFAVLSGGSVKRIDGLGMPADVPIQKRPALAGGS